MREGGRKGGIEGERSIWPVLDLRILCAKPNDLVRPDPSIHRWDLHSDFGPGDQNHCVITR